MLRTLEEHFGFDAFREGQEPVIHALMEGRSALAVFPTGGGKSLCYQLPALLLDGVTLVISPLIALMKDQVDRLTARGISAARLDSTLDAAEVMEINRRLDAGELKLLYVAPERLANERFRQRLERLPIAMAAIDEAHCISEWGHNFRPDYLKLAMILKDLGVKRILALTATATPSVAEDIRGRFGISPEDHIQLSFHRTNLDLKTTVCEVKERKALLLERIRRTDGAAVVYVTRQETAEEIGTFLARNGVSAQAYHAGLPPETRAAAQLAFMDGGIRVIVATIAFGMGIDKADIRAVYHYNLPKSLENYSQEIGRAGRDGKPAVCEMLACGEDLVTLENFIHADTPTKRALANLLDRVLRLGTTFDVSVYDLSVSCDIRTQVVATVMTYLETDGHITATGTFYSTYRVKLLQPQERIFSGRPPEEADFLRKLWKLGEEKRTWRYFDPSAAAVQLEVTRERVVAALSELERAGDVALEISGVRQGYRMLKEGNPREIAERFAEKFSRRETADLDRLGLVSDLPGRSECLTGCLTGYFGEKLPAPCGHCDRCRGLKPESIRRPQVRKAEDGEWAVMKGLIDERHPALATPRQLARFLSGMTSPAATRAGLTRHDAFGMLADIPFREILDQVNAARG